jgi:hypothetical protein
MMRNLLSAGIATLALLAPMSLNSTARAQTVVVPAHHRHHHHERFEVLFRASPFLPYQVYGAYHSPGLAREVALGLRFQGFQVRVLRVLV